MSKAFIINMTGNVFCSKTKFNACPLGCKYSQNMLVAIDFKME